MESIQTYLNDIQGISLLTEEEEKHLGKDELITHNLRLALSLAKNFQNRGLPLEDLIQEANIGLMTAAEKFNPEMGCRFSTYAAWWVRQALSKAVVNYGHTIRIPSHIVELNSKIEKSITELIAELGRYPNDAEIAARVGVELSDFAAIRSYFNDPISIDNTIGEDEDDSFSSLIADTTLESPIEYCLNNENERIVNAVLATIPAREAIIIRMRIQDGKSLEDVGMALNLTAERVRQLELKALRKLRHPYRAEILRNIDF